MSRGRKEITLALGQPPILSKTQQEKERKRKVKARIVVEHVDIIRDDFWAERADILGAGSSRMGTS